MMFGLSAVGVAADDTVHLLHRTPRSSLARRTTFTLAECWRPCVGSSLIAACCLAVFALSPFRPTAQFGVLLAAAILAALLADMLVLPAALRLLNARRITVGAAVS
jgi:predicted RND superfamily exporter protein